MFLVDRFRNKRTGRGRRDEFDGEGAYSNYQSKI